MGMTNTRSWIRAGLLGLPLYGLLTLWASRGAQPNPDEDYEAWARFVTTDVYLLTHVLGSGLGLIVVIFGTFALSVHLAGTRAARLGLAAMVIAVFGQSIFLFFEGVSAFGSPLEGRAYLAGMNLDELPGARRAPCKRSCCSREFCWPSSATFCSASPCGARSHYRSGRARSGSSPRC